jgi:hypothetical protein
MSLSKRGGPSITRQHIEIANYLPRTGGWSQPEFKARGLQTHPLTQVVNQETLKRCPVLWVQYKGPPE